MPKGVPWLPSAICWSHELRERQPGVQEPVRIAVTCDNARWAGVWSSVVESYHMTKQWVSPPGDDVIDIGQVGSVGDFCRPISDEVMPAYPEDHTLAAHVEGLKLP